MNPAQILILYDPMNKSNWIKILASACFVVWLVALSLVNLLDKKTPAKLMTVETRWADLAAEQTKLEAEIKTLDLSNLDPAASNLDLDASNLDPAASNLDLDASNLDPARKLVSVYAQQNLFSRAETVAEKILHVAGDDSLADLKTLAAIERQKGDYKKCIQTLESILKLDQSDLVKSAGDQINLGTVYYLNGLSMERTEERILNFRKAKECFTNAEKLIPTNPEKAADLIALKQNRALNERELKKLSVN